MTDRVIAVEVDAYDPDGDSTLTLYLSNTPYISQSGDTPSSTAFSALLESPYQYSANLISEEGFGGGLPISFGAIEIMTPKGSKVSTSSGLVNSEDITKYDYRDRAVRWYYSAERGAAYSSFTTLNTGAIETFDATQDIMTLYPYGKDVLLNRSLTTSEYLGLGGALRFGGGTHEVSISDDAVLDQNTTFTLEAIAKYISDTGDTSQIIVGKNGNYFLFMNTSGELLARLIQTDGTRHDLTSTHVLSSTAYESIAVVWDSTLADSKMYVDGMDTGASYSTTTDTYDGTNPLRFGRVSSSNNANIDLAQVRLWSDVRTVAEIQQNMFSTPNGDEADLSGLWLINEGTGTTTADETSNGNNGTITDASWIHTLEGDDWNLKGKNKPVSIGIVLNRKAILVDGLRLIYQLHDGTLDSVDAVYANRDPIALDTGVGTGGDTTDLFSNSPAAAKYITDLTNGFIKLGSDYGSNTVITADVTYDPGGTGTSPVDVSKELIENWTPNLSSSDTDITAIDPTGIAGSVGLEHEEVTTLDLVEAMLIPTTTFWRFTRAGKFKVNRINDPSGESASDTLDETVVAVAEASIQYQIPPLEQIRLGYDKFWYVHSASEVSSTAAVDDLNVFERSQKEYLYIVVDDPDIAADYLGARERIVEGNVVWDQSTFNQDRVFIVEAQLHMDLFNAPRRVIRLPLAKESFAEYNLGDVLALDFSGMDQPLFGIDSATNYLVAGIDESDTQTVLLMWGP